jgi:hypothetical protein
MGFMVDKLELGHAFLRVIRSCPSLHQRTTFKSHWSHTQCSSGGHHVALGPNWCVSCKLPILNDVQVFHMHTRPTSTAIYNNFWRKEIRNYLKLTYCTCMNRNKKPSNKSNIFYFFINFGFRNFCVWPPVIQGVSEMLGHRWRVNSSY